MSDFAKMAAIAKHFVNNGDGSIHLHSENGTAYELAVDNAGALTVTNEATGAVSGVGGGTGLPTGGAAHQQLVTDADGKALWEDRLAYAESGVVEILPETTVPIVGDENPVTEQFAAPLVEGNKYTITYNGTAYECTAQPFDVGGAACTALGNLGVMTGGEDTGEPFVLLAIPPTMAIEIGATAMLVPLDGAETVTIKISGKGETVHRLDRKYLPEYIYGDEVENVTFLSETTLEPVQIADGASVYLLTRPYDSPLVMNATYTVVWNGTAYECEPYEITSNGEDYIHLGVNGVFQINTEPGEYGDAPFFGMIYAFDGSTSLTISITGVVTTVYQVPDKYLKLNLVNGSAEGSLRSVNANEESEIYKMGPNAIAIGEGSEAKGESALAIGAWSRADAYHACAIAGGSAEGNHSVAIGDTAWARGERSVAIGRYVAAGGSDSFAIGCGNKWDNAGKYVFIVGNGRSYAGENDYENLSNAHAIDWDGNAWYQGYVEGAKLILPSPNGTRWAITVGDDGTLSAAAVTE